MRPPDPMLPPPLGAGAALFLDFDGCLVEIADRPDAVQVDGALLALLRTLIWRHDRAVAVISGRPVQELLRYLPLPGLSVAGVHGAELQLPGDVRPQCLAEPLPAVCIQSLNKAVASLSGVMLEPKRYAVALHYRNAPQHADACRNLASKHALEHGLDVLDGKAVVELRRPGLDKGRALSRLMQEPAFAGRLPVAVGDDRTDIDAFRAAQALGGFGLGIGRCFGVADYRLDSPEQLHHWLSCAAPPLPADRTVPVLVA